MTLIRKSISERAALRVKVATLAALQDADETGGPDWREYAALMDELAAECAARAKRARDTFGPERCLAIVQEWCGTQPGGLTAEVWETCLGGQSHAIGVQPRHAEWAWLLTDADGDEPPTDPAAAIIVGFYTASGRYLTFRRSSLADACDLMASLCGKGF